MWKCHKCGKPVYFAERKQSLGYDWHPECLRCEECGKRLNPGQHAEHKGVPYCHVPCYGALFGPQLYGHGTRVESHTSFGKVENKSSSKNMPRSHLESKLKVFNQYYDGRSGGIRCREVNGRLVLEGALRIRWGVSGVIHLKEDDDQRTVVTIRKRNSYRYSGINMNGIEKVENGGYEGDMKTYTRGPVTVAQVVDVEEASSENLCGKSLTLPSKLDLNKIHWNQLDELLQVERRFGGGDKLYQTMPGRKCLPLPSTPTGSSNSSTSPLSSPSTPTSHQLQTDNQNGDDYSRCFEDTLELGISIDRSQSNPEALCEGNVVDWSGGESESETRSEARGLVGGTGAGVGTLSGGVGTGVRRRAPILRANGARARRRRLKRRSSINGHFYNRETSFFTPPYGSQMSVWVTSLVSTNEVINLMLDKYKVDSKADSFALCVVRDNGEQRILKEEEYPLVTRVMLGPHEDVARLYLMDRQSTQEISTEVAQFLNLALPECTAILDRFDWEEQREKTKITTRFKEMRKRIKQRMEELKVHL